MMILGAKEKATRGWLLYDWWVGNVLYRTLCSNVRLRLYLYKAKT